MPEIDFKRIGVWVGLLEGLSLDVSGSLWERIFAESVGAEYRNTSESFGDVILGDTAWECKTKKIKTSTPPEYLSCIMGRVAIPRSESFGAEELASVIVGIFNHRLSDARQKYGNVGLSMLVRGANSFFLSLTKSLDLIDEKAYKWEVSKVQKGIRLKGSVDGVPFVYWTSSGGQLSIRLKVENPQKLEITPTQITIDKLIDGV